MAQSRRDFLKRSAATGAVASTPIALSDGVAFAQEGGKQKTIAAIGVGGSRGRYNRGGSIARNAAKFGNMIAVCDVDQLHCDEFNKAFGGELNTYTDYRKLLENEQPDIVTIGTPDHWHVPIAIAALRAGCDVYCEKPLTLTIEEGQQICAVVEETGRVFQVGTQQRSENGGKFLKAIALVQSGRLGKNVNAYVAIGGAPGAGPFKATEPPEGLDWNMWLGPAQKEGYSEQRRRMFRWWFEYSGGKMTDWGAHHVDIAQWALGQDQTGPVKVSGKGKLPEIVPTDFNWQSFFDGKAELPDGYNTATEFDLTLTYANGATMNVTDRYQRPEEEINFPNGILFEGELGRIFVNRGKLQGAPLDALTEADEEELQARMVALYGGQPGNHMQNFFHSVEDRSQPVSDVFSHHRTMTSCHLLNLCLMLGRDLQWDPKNERFLDDDQANALRSRKRRDGFA